MARKIAYWVSTGLVAVMSLMAAFTYLSGSPQAVEGFARAGYPQQLRVILGIAKPLGALALLVPGVPKLKEWVYAGFTFAWNLCSHCALSCERWREDVCAGDTVCAPRGLVCDAATNSPLGN